MYNVLFVGWNSAKTGREKHANELFMNFLGYLTKQQATGTIESFEPVLLEQHGGEMNGFVMVRGNRDKLHAMTNTDDWMNLIVDGGVTMNNFGVVHGYTGPAMQKMMTMWQSKI